MPPRLEEKFPPEFEWHYSINPAEVTAVEIVSLNPKEEEESGFAGKYKVMETTRLEGLEAFKLAYLWRTVIPMEGYIRGYSWPDFGVRFFTKEGPQFEIILSYRYWYIVQQFSDGRRTVTGFLPHTSAVQKFQSCCLKSIRHHPGGRWLWHSFLWENALIKTVHFVWELFAKAAK